MVCEEKNNDAIIGERKGVALSTAERGKRARIYHTMPSGTHDIIWSVGTSHFAVWVVRLASVRPEFDPGVPFPSVLCPWEEQCVRPK